MASNSVYEQREFFNSNELEVVRATIILNEIINRNDLKEKFRNACINSSITGELRVYINK